MADSHAKTHTVLLTVNSKKVTVELFAADGWPDKNTGQGLYRVRVQGSWHTAQGKYTFLPLSAVAELIASLLQGGKPVQQAPRPKGFEKPCRVSVMHGECISGVPLHIDGGWTCTPPHCGADGRWYLWCSVASGKVEVPVEDVKKHRR